MRRTPALIVGGGPAGASAAIVLARAGMPHLLVERSRETGDAICGGFLSWRTLESLATLGIDPAALGPARVTDVRLFAGGRHAEARLPRPAHGVSRRLLDTVVLARAMAAGAAVERGVTVREIAGATVRFEDGAELRGDALFLASGKHDVRGLARPAEARGDDPVLGLRVRLPPTPGLARMIGSAIELHLIDRGYVGIVLQEDGSANVCMAVHRSAMLAAGSPAALLDALGVAHPRLGDRLGYRASAAPIDAIANVPYGWRARTTGAGVFRLGDQAGRHPVAGGRGDGHRHCERYPRRECPACRWPGSGRPVPGQLRPRDRPPDSRRWPGPRFCGAPGPCGNPAGARAGPQPDRDCVARNPDRAIRA